MVEFLQPVYTGVIVLLTLSTIVELACRKEIVLSELTTKLILPTLSVCFYSILRNHQAETRVWKAFKLFLELFLVWAVFFTEIRTNTQNILGVVQPQLTQITDQIANITPEIADIKDRGQRMESVVPRVQNVEETVKTELSPMLKNVSDILRPVVPRLSDFQSQMNDLKVQVIRSNTEMHSNHEVMLNFMMHFNQHQYRDEDKFVLMKTFQVFQEDVVSNFTKYNCCHLYKQIEADLRADDN